MVDLINFTMAESNPPRTEIEIMKEALLAQQQLLQQLYSELELERESSATAASEALSMILRLQGEKASLNLEAGQYKRMAEEKMCHAEEALAIFEEVISQREMEVAYLEYQVQAYRYKLLSMGCNDLGPIENKYPENLLSQSEINLFGEKGINGNVRRLNSLPQIPVLDSNFKRTSLESKRSATPPPDFPSIMQGITSYEANNVEKPGCSSNRDINAYWEQIKKLDERVKEISDYKDTGSTKPAIWKGSTWSPSMFSQANGSTPVDRTKGVNTTSKVKHQENLQEKEGATSDLTCSSTVQDIFEVPKVGQSHKASLEPPSSECCKIPLNGKSKVAKADLISEGGFESPSEEKTDGVKTMLLPANNEKKIPRIARGLSTDNMALAQSLGVTDLQAQYQQLNRRVERLERARLSVPRQEITGAGGMEELRLLKEICTQLKCLQSEMRTLKHKKPALSNDPSLDPLQEAMVHFWL